MFEGLGVMYDVVAWPMALAGSFGGEPVPSAVGAAGGAGVVYYVWGNPIPLIEEMDLMKIGMAYIAFGVAFVAGREVARKVNNAMAGRS
jgi:hypothetical protein